MSITSYDDVSWERMSNAVVAAVRNTQDVDILLRREELTAAASAMNGAGFVYRHVPSIDLFLDGPNAKARSVLDDPDG